MKRFLFLIVIIVATIKITLFINKKQTEKLLLEKKTKETPYTKEELSDMSKAMYNYDYLNYKIKRELKNDLKDKAQIPSSEVQPLYPNRKVYNQYNSDDEEGYIKNDPNDRLYMQGEAGEDDEDKVEMDERENLENTENDEDINTDEEEVKPRPESIRKINSLKDLIKNNLRRTNRMDNEVEENDPEQLQPRENIVTEPQIETEEE